MYALDNERIMRLTTVPRQHYLDRKALYDELRDLGFPYALPDLLEIGVEHGTTYTVERRIPGRSLDLASPTLAGDARTTALDAFADAAHAIGQIPFERPYFGNVLPGDVIRTDSWPEHLVGRAAHSVARGGEQLRSDIPDIDDHLARFAAEVSHLTDVPHRLVHGDYFPGNVMVDERGVTGVIDFSFWTMCGDPRADLVGAVVFLEGENPWGLPGDAEHVRARLEVFDQTLSDVFDIYRRWYGFVFSFVFPFSTRLYRWCLGAIRSA